MPRMRLLKLLAACALAVCLAAGLAGCAQVITELKASRNNFQVGLHERLSWAIQDNGFNHDVRSIREDGRSVDILLVAVPLDTLKRQYITLHHMLFSIGRICAHPDFADIDIRIELNGRDEEDQLYMRSVVLPLVAEARNVTLTSAEGSASDVVVVLTQTLPKGTRPVAR